MKYSNLSAFFVQRFRRKRLRWFRKAFPPEVCRTILDVGGTPQIWTLLNYSSDVTLVNNDPRELSNANGFHTAIGDGRALEFPDKSFDLAFSNSVIEHVGDWTDMKRFAAELQRVGKSFYCQTPNKWFPIEPHFGTLFLHWIPWLLNRYVIVRYLTLWGLMNRPSPDQVARSLSEIRLLTCSELKLLFPDAQIVTERFLLLPKSYIAVRR